MGRKTKTTGDWRPQMVVSMGRKAECAVRVGAAAVVGAWSAVALYASGTEIPVERVVPDYKKEQLVVSSAGFDAGEMAYLAFPDLVRLDDSRVLIAYKRGKSHALDAGAALEAVWFDTRERKVIRRELLAADPERIYQMGEFIVFAGGRIGVFADVQRGVPDRGRMRHHRTGVEWAMSDDGGETFSAMQKMGAVEGVEYGYIFEGLVSEGRTYMLAMSFPETESGSFFDEDGNRVYGEVSVLASADEGETWNHVRNLSREFGGIDINESSFLRWGDGYVVVTRGYDGNVRMHRVDRAFRLVRESSLTERHGFIQRHIGRPRLFERDGKLYLLGRNHPPDRGMELALFRIDPESLTVEHYAALDPDPGGDGSTPRVVWNHGVRRTDLRSERRIPLGEWAHLAVTLDAGSGTLKLFVDGDLQDYAGGVATTPFERISVGKRAAGGGHLIAGMIRDLRIYDRALSDAEVKALGGGNPVDRNRFESEEGLVGHWPNPVEGGEPYADPEGLPRLRSTTWSARVKQAETGPYASVITADFPGAEEGHILDLVATGNVGDSYYAVPYFEDRDGTTLLHVITYRTLGNPRPDIVRLEFSWDEVR